MFPVGYGHQPVIADWVSGQTVLCVYTGENTLAGAGGSGAYAIFYQPVPTPNISGLILFDMEMAPLHNTHG